MRKVGVVLFAALAVVIAGCVTINVYFPAAAAEQAARKFIGHVINAPGELPPSSSSAPDEPSSEPLPAGAASAYPPLSLVDLLIPAAHAAEQADIRISTPRIEALRARMRARFQSRLKPLLDSGAIGFTHDGLVALHDAGAVPLAQRNQVRQLIAEENADRKQVYQQVAVANGHAEWEPKIQATFAREWINEAHGGWYYQNAAGDWLRK
ncbi:MAG TPA: YdbL family protein [Rhodanobacteraceae bacterium]|nr:YdbL family protein [Rhodanobacteraceae bacterium]